MSSVTMDDLWNDKNPIYIKKVGNIGYLILNRPDKKNAVNLVMWDLMPKCLTALETDNDVRVVIVTSSSDGSFCAGADISEFEKIAMDEKLREKQRQLIRNGQRTLAELNKPTIAMINGPCIGAGCGISIHCDFRFASQISKFGITPAKLGLVYPLNDTRHLVDLVGPANAKRILFTAGIFTASEALSMGLIDHMAEDVRTLQQDVNELASSMSVLSSYSLTGIKKTIRRIVEGQVDDDEETSSWFTNAYSENDYKEGVLAFKEKRQPKFGG